MPFSQFFRRNNYLHLLAIFFSYNLRPAGERKYFNMFKRDDKYARKSNEHKVWKYSICPFLQLLDRKVTLGVECGLRLDYNTLDIRGIFSSSLKSMWVERRAKLSYLFLHKQDWITLPRDRKLGDPN